MQEISRVAASKFKFTIPQEENKRTISTPSSMLLSSQNSTSRNNNNNNNTQNRKRIFDCNQQTKTLPRAETSNLNTNPERINGLSKSAANTSI